MTTEQCHLLSSFFFLAEDSPARRVPRRLKAMHFMFPCCRYSSITSGKPPCNGIFTCHQETPQRNRNMKRIRVPPFEPRIAKQQDTESIGHTYDWHIHRVRQPPHQAKSLANKSRRGEREREGEQVRLQRPLAGYLHQPSRGQPLTPPLRGAGGKKKKEERRPCRRFTGNPVARLLLHPLLRYHQSCDL